MMVTAVSYPDKTDPEMYYTVYTVPSENYHKGMSEAEAADVATEVEVGQFAPGACGVEKVDTSTVRQT